MDNIWTDFAISYDNVIPELSCYRRKLAKILRDTADCKLIIDAGCGTGLVSEELVKRGQTVFGFDNNSGMLGQAYRRHALMTPAQQAFWKLVEGDVQNFPVDTPRQADAIVLNNVLFYVPEPERCLELCSKHLSPTGRLIITGPTKRPDINKILRLSVEDWKTEGRYTPELEQAFNHHSELARKLAGGEEMCTFYQPEELLATLKDFGFGQVLEANGTEYYGESAYVAVARHDS